MEFKGTAVAPLGQWATIQDPKLDRLSIHPNGVEVLRITHDGKIVLGEITKTDPDKAACLFWKAVDGIGISYTARIAALERDNAELRTLLGILARIDLTQIPHGSSIVVALNRSEIAKAQAALAKADGKEGSREHST